MRHDSPRTTLPRPGFTMMELIVALSISTAVMLGVVSLLSLASSAVPQPGGIQETAVDGADFLARLTSDIACATQITQAEAAAITIIVPDRTGDAVAETISYSWDAGVGDPVIRDYNGRITAILQEVALLQFVYSRGPATIASQLTKATSGSQVLCSNISTTPSPEKMNGTAIGTVLIEPILAGNAIAWALESLTLYFKYKGSKDDFAEITLHGCDEDGLPTDALYAVRTVAESDMTGGLTPFTVNYGGILVPAGERLCIVVRCIEARPEEGEIWVGTTGSAASADENATLGNPLSFEASGTITTLSQGPVNRDAVTGVFVRLRAGSESWSEQMSLPIVNAAEIVPE